MMKLERMLASLSLFLLPLLALAGAARAEVGLESSSTAIGRFNNEFGVSHEEIGSTSDGPNGSRFNHLGCFGSDENEIGCTISGTPWPLDDWWDRPVLPTWAAGQTYADFGTLQARSVVVFNPAGDGVSLPSPGFRTFDVSSVASWREDLINTGSQPTLVTFDFTLDATWNDYGRFALTIGEEYFGFDQYEVDGVSYRNCELGSNECDLAPGEGTLIHVPGNDPENRNGSVNQLVSFTLLVPPVDPEDMNPTTFLAKLETFATEHGAEVDAFQTVTLDRIRVEPGAQLSFGSGTAWNIVVPEPATYVLWLMGLAGVAAGRLRQRR